MFHGFKYLSAVVTVTAGPPPAVQVTHTHTERGNRYRGGADAYLSLCFSPLTRNVRTIFKTSVFSEDSHRNTFSVLIILE